LEKIERMNFHQRKGSVLILVLCIVSALYFTPVKGEDETYSHIATIHPPIPHGFSGFGAAVILTEDFLLIGETDAYYAEDLTGGKIFIYDLDWNLVSSILSPNPSQNEQFSNSVEVLDDLILVGCAAANVGDYIIAGEVYLFDKDGNLLLILQSPNPRDTGTFGSEVNMRNGFILVSETSGFIDGMNAPGLVHVFDMEGNHITTLRSPSMKPNGKFGRSIEMNDEFIVISEVGTSDNSLKECSVYVYDYDWNLVATLHSPDDQPYSHYGRALEITNDLLLVCERWATVDGHVRAGRAHLYDMDWNLIKTFQAPEPEDYDEYGRGLCIGGDLILVGERGRDVSNMNQGMVYVYDLEGNPITTIVSPEPEIGAEFGWGVETDGELILVSHIEASSGGVGKTGRVEIFAPGTIADDPPSDDEVSDTDDTSSSESRVIPGFPYESIILGIVSLVLFLRVYHKR
jgi:hypothetical protein